MVTYSELFQYSLVIIGIIGLFICGAARNMKVNGAQNVTDNR